MNQRLQDPLREVIFLDKTQAPALIDEDVESVSNIARLAGGVPDALMRGLIESARSARPLDWRPIMVNARFVTEKELGGGYRSGQGTHRIEFWEEFRSSFPQHTEFYALSSVVFNDDYSEAALVMSYYCPAMCGSGEFLLYLEKHGMTWKTVGGTFFWTT